jgi:hypothetical protein
MTAVAQELAFGVTIAGAALDDVIAVSASAGVEQRFSRATITVASDPGVLLAGSDVVVTVTVNGDSATLFRGDYTGQAWTLDAGRTINIECAGILARLQRPWGGPDRVYSPETTTTEAERVDAAIIRNLIEAWGIDSARHEVFESEWEDPDDPGNPPIQWILGEIEPVVLKNGESPLQLIDAIDEVPGFATYDQLTGYIQRARYNTYYSAPTVDAAWVEGQDGVRVARLGPTFGAIVNRVIVRGLTYEGIPIEAGSEAANPDLNGYYPPELQDAYVGRELASDLIEFQHFAQQAAAIQVQDTNRRTDGWEIVLAGDPQQHTLELQVTVSLDFPSLGSTGPTKHRIVSIAHELSADPWSFVTTIRTNGGELV